MAIIDEDRKNEALQKAEDAFWQSIASSFPEAKRGDFPPDASAEFGEAIKRGLDVWLESNVPDGVQ